MADRRARRRRPRIAVPVVVVLALLVFLGSRFVGLYTDLLWFREVGYSRVFTTVLWARIGLFAVAALVMALVVGANIVIARRLRPPFRPQSMEQQNLERYRSAIDPYRVAALVLVCLVVGAVAGVAVSSRWETWLAWRNAAPFGVEDPQFHRDISYFAFTYPFQRLVLGFAFAAVVLSAVAAAVTHYLYGGVRLQTAGEKVLPAARAHLSVLLGLFVLLKALAYWLDQYGLAFSPRGKVTGASYTDVNAQLPALKILTVIAVICAVLFVANLRSRGWALPATAFSLLLVSSIVVGGVYPFAVQQFQVKPNEIQREAQYIKRNIDATLAAYKIQPGEDVEYRRYDADSDITAAAVRADRGVLPYVRLLDPNKLRDTFESLQQIRGYYGFPDSLDVDRYDVEGRTETYVVAAREIDHAGLAPNQQNWINEHLVYTHGYGFVAAPANEVEAESGRPVFAVRDIPPRGTIDIAQPRVYYGEKAPDYSVVGTSQTEIDRPGSGAGEEVRFTYDGKGGVGIGNLFRRALFAARFGSRYLLLSGALDGESKILYNRKPIDRVRKVAPYLELDSDPYPAVVDGRIVWVVDGYTTSDGYPYSQRVGFGAVTRDSQGRAQSQGQINYIRNSVKATVDAYDGTVTLYAWDETDPVLRTWSRVFPGTVQPRSAIPPGLLPHLRYPEDLFKVQRELIASYHVTDPSAFFIGGDFWQVPADPNAGRAGERPDQPPFYQYLQMPGSDRPRFMLTSPLATRNRPNLAAYLAVSSEQGDYGKIEALQLPTNTSVLGPEQRGSTFQTDPEASKELSLLGGQGSNTVFGNLLILPVAGNLIAVQPVYVESSEAGAKLPLLKRVLVGYGDRVGFGASLETALNQVFGRGTAPATPGPGTGSDAALRKAVADANEAYQDGLEALSRRDLAAYAEAQERLEAALERAAELSGGAGASPSPSPSASPR